MTRIQAIAWMVPGSPSMSRSRRLHTAPPRSAVGTTKFTRSVTMIARASRIGDR